MVKTLILLCGFAVMIGILVGCPSQTESRTSMPASVKVEKIGDDIILDIYAGTVPLPALFYDMENMPRVADDDNYVVIVNNSWYPYWWYNYPAGYLYPHQYSYWVDYEYAGHQYPAYDETQVLWGVALHFDDDTIPLTVITESFVRGTSLRINLSDYVPNRVNSNVDVYLVAQYPGMAPTYCPISVGQSGTFCWGRLGNFNLSVDGKTVSEVSLGGVGQGYFSFGWPFGGTTPTPDDTFTLTTSVQGSGSITPVGGEYDAGEVVSVTATPATGWSFSHWLVNGSQGSSNVLAQVTMNSDVNLIAIFTQNNDPNPPVSVAGVEFTRSGNTGTMRINPGTASLRAITANDSAQYLPANATFADITGIGVEIVNIPSPYWYIREVSSGTMAANAWSTTIQLDGNGTDSNGYAKTLALANWSGGRAIPFYTIASVPGRIFSLNTGANGGTLNGSALSVDVVGYIWP